MHELTNPNILNLFGVGLEIFGFFLLIPHLKRWLHKRLHRLAVEEDKKSEGASLGIDESHEVVINVLTHYWKKLENVAISIIIIGLFFQGLSVLIHS